MTVNDSPVTQKPHLLEQVLKVVLESEVVVFIFVV